MTSPTPVEQLMHDLTRSFKAFAALRTIAPALHPGIEQASIPLLFRLSERPVRVGELAELIHSDISTVSRQISPLVMRGLVEKTPDPDDRRAQVLALTDRGRAVAEQLRAQRCGLMAALLHDWPEAKIQAAAEVLGEFADSLETALRTPELRNRLPEPVIL